MVDLCRVIAWMQELCSLDVAPSQTQKIRSFKVMSHFFQDSHSTLFYFWPIEEMVEDILKDLDEKIAFPQAVVKAKKLTELLATFINCHV